MDDGLQARLDAWKHMNEIGKALSSWYRVRKQNPAEAFQIVCREMIATTEASFDLAYREWARLAFPEDRP